ncbi:MAG: S8 family serine peptidase [Bacteroidales bacterium]|jgi:subtilisin family serine protease|nr:S8 family serine peptidase [Bacteroidales bacterium]HOW08899.1 S8 family serine peptidase [Bacteroidales bacterium]
MYTYTLGGKNGRKYVLRESSDMVAVRLMKPGTMKNIMSSARGKKILKDFELIEEFPEADISVFQAKESVSEPALARDMAKSALKDEPGLRFAGKVLIDAESNTLVLYTENIFIKFHDEVKAAVCEKIITDNGLKIKQRPRYAQNAYFVGAPENTGVRVFEIAEKLLQMPEVELCHPELIRKRSLKRIHPDQWHLMKTKINRKTVDAGISADSAHKLTTGKGIVIALIDDGVDTDHQEFRMKGKVINPRDVTENNDDPGPKTFYDNHGTACAGVAAASGVEASGVAPDAMLMPVRLSSNLGSIAEANAFIWAADHGADIISCSWGPEDGNWSDPDDPVHFAEVGLPDSTRLAIDYAIKAGRGGKGCIITFAAGNGNEDCRYDGYAGYEKVVAVSACNDTGKRSIYSDFGKNVWCSFPSSDFGYAPFNHPKPLTKGIYTTDRHGESGYNPEGNYTDSFGGTSSSCPGVAGTAALILSVNPELTWLEVREIIAATADKIDIDGGLYDETGHSIYYGYGRVNAEKAVKRAMELVNRKRLPHRRSKTRTTV